MFKKAKYAILLVTSKKEQKTNAYCSCSSYKKFFEEIQKCGPETIVEIIAPF